MRRISLPTHGTIEMLAGIALMAAPFAFGFGALGTVAAIGLGVLLVGLALSGADSLPLATHLAFDQVLGSAFVVAALGLALAGDRAAGTVFLAAAALQFVLTAATRYSRPVRVSHASRF
jgi:hypothetical protein